MPNVLAEGATTVSYTHLDVYKRQVVYRKHCLEIYPGAGISWFLKFVCQPAWQAVILSSQTFPQIKEPFNGKTALTNLKELSRRHTHTGSQLNGLAVGHQIHGFNR